MAERGRFRGPRSCDDLPRQLVGHLLGLPTGALLAGEEQCGAPLLGVDDLRRHTPLLGFLHPDLGQGPATLDHYLLQTGQFAEDARGGPLEVGAAAEVVGAVPEQAAVPGIQCQTGAQAAVDRQQMG
jgi:hypothetical protein